MDNNLTNLVTTAVVMLLFFGAIVVGLRWVDHVADRNEANRKSAQRNTPADGESVPR